MINKKRILYLILTLMMAIIIFFFSSQNSKDSNGLSYRIDIKIFNLINRKTETTSASSVESNYRVKVDKNKEPKYPVNDKRFRDIDFVVRKTAHVTLYALFAVFLTLFLKTYSFKNKKVVLIVLIIGFLYACLDELNQKLGGTRTGIFTDTLIDTFGCTMGLTITFICKSFLKSRKNVRKIY